MIDLHISNLTVLKRKLLDIDPYFMAKKFFPETHPIATNYLFEMMYIGQRANRFFQIFEDFGIPPEH